MSIPYDEITEFHYASYRPALHEAILHNCLGKTKFSNGLDIGCGTGVSAIALKRYCDRVTGVDPNEKMISQTVTEPNIDYQILLDKNLPFPDDTFDICTYAGAWWYGKSQALLDETIRVSTRKGILLFYDFNLDFKYIHDKLDVIPTELGGYDHYSNLENLNTSEINSTSMQKDTKKLLLSPKQIAHLLCSEKPIYDQFVSKFSTDSPFNQLVEQISNLLNSASITITANTYYSLYRL